MVFENAGPRNTMTLEDVDRSRSYRINAVYFSNHDPEQLHWLDTYNREMWTALDKRNLDAMDLTGAPEFERDAFNASVICPTIRTLRLHEAACKGNDNSFGCQKFPLARIRAPSS